MKRQVEITQMRQFGTRLREERRRLGLNQRDFAALGGVEFNTQSLYEKGDRKPAVDYLLLLSESGVDPTYLLTGQRRDPSSVAEVGAPFIRDTERANDLEPSLLALFRALTRPEQHIALRLLGALPTP